MAGASGDVCPFFAGGHAAAALGAAFNQMVHSRAQLLLLDFFFGGDNTIYFKSVLRWEPANATGFSLRTRVPRYHYLGVLVR